MNAYDKPFQVMLAKDAVLDKLRFPLCISAKLDGVRAYVRDGIVYSRKNLPIPNRHVQNLFGHLEHFDGELIVGSPTAHDVMRQTMSGVMSRDKIPDVTLYAFDYIETLSVKYICRANKLLSFWPQRKVIFHTQYLVRNLPEVLEYEQLFLDMGYEGLILRDLDAPYKMGRSTVNEGYLLKLKRFIDAEFEVIGFEERQHNGNEATINELGQTKRSSHQSGKIGRGDLGALVLQGDGFTFNCGTGFTDTERAHIWQRQDQYLGKLAKVKYFAIGMKDAPRHPVFLGWRDSRDA